MLRIREGVISKRNTPAKATHSGATVQVVIVCYKGLVCFLCLVLEAARTVSTTTEQCTT